MKRGCHLEPFVNADVDVRRRFPVYALPLIVANNGLAGVRVLPPDIHPCEAQFTPDDRRDAQESSLSACAALTPERWLDNPPSHNSARKGGLVSFPAIEGSAQLATGAQGLISKSMRCSQSNVHPTTILLSRGIVSPLRNSSNLPSQP